MLSCFWKLNSDQQLPFLSSFSPPRSFSSWIPNQSLFFLCFSSSCLLIPLEPWAFILSPLLWVYFQQARITLVSNSKLGKEFWKIAIWDISTNNYLSLHHCYRFWSSYYHWGIDSCIGSSKFCESVMKTVRKVQEKEVDLHCNTIRCTEWFLLLLVRF